MHQREVAFELLVIEGRDAGRRFSLDGRDVPIGRDVVTGWESGGIVLADPTVSAQQAMIHVTPDGPVIEHRTGATNATLVNGLPIKQKPLASGDRIQMGSVVLEFLVHTREYRAASREETVRRDREPWGRLRLASGPRFGGESEFRLHGDQVSIGRGLDCDVRIPEPGISRLHAQLVWQGNQLFLEHRSGTSSTCVDGRTVSDRVELAGDAEIQLSDNVVLRLELRRPAGSAPGPHVEADGAIVRRTESPGLLTSFYASIEREQDLHARLEQGAKERVNDIDEKFGFTGAFLDVDVVDSYGMKERASRPDYIVVSFDRFRSFVTAVIEEFDGQILNSNGDELMCFFKSPLQAVRAASAVVVRLEDFNRNDNLLVSNFRVRQGIHTGRSLIDWKRNVAYSSILDVAGHLQKHAEVDGVLISQQTLEALPEGLPFERKGELERERIPTYRLAARLA